MKIKRRKSFKYLFEDEAAGQQQPQQQGQEQGQQQPQQQQPQQQQGPNIKEIQTKILNASNTILQSMLEVVNKNISEIPGIAKEDANIPYSKDIAALYQEMSQKKDFDTIGKFLVGLNAFGQKLGQNQQEGQQGQQQQNNQQQAQQQPQEQTQQQAQTTQNESFAPFVIKSAIFS